MTLPALFSFINSGVGGSNSTSSSENAAGLAQQPLNGINGLGNALAYGQPLAGMNSFANALAYQLQLSVNFGNHEQFIQQLTDQEQFDGSNLPLFEQILPFADHLKGNAHDAEYLADLLQQQLPRQQIVNQNNVNPLVKQINTQINEEASPVYTPVTRLQENNNNLFNSIKVRPMEATVVSTLQGNDMQAVQNLQTVLKSGMREHISEIIKDRSDKFSSDSFLKVPLDLPSAAIQNQYGVNSTQRQFSNIPIPVGKSGWSSAIAERVTLFSANNISQAKISLEPPELGALAVKIAISNDQANVSFISPHGAVREAVEQSITRLQELLQEQGLNLVNVDISDQSHAQSQNQQEQDANKEVDLLTDGLLDEEKQGHSGSHQLGLIDDFA